MLPSRCSLRKVNITVTKYSMTKRITIERMRSLIEVRGTYATLKLPHASENLANFRIRLMTGSELNGWRVSKM